jgi:hypothetical protein
MQYVYVYKNSEDESVDMRWTETHGGGGPREVRRESGTSRREHNADHLSRLRESDEYRQIATGCEDSIEGGRVTVEEE